MKTKIELTLKERAKVRRLAKELTELLGSIQAPEDCDDSLGEETVKGTTGKILQKLKDELDDWYF